MNLMIQSTVTTSFPPGPLVPNIEINHTVSEKRNDLTY